MKDTSKKTKRSTAKTTDKASPRRRPRTGTGGPKPVRRAEPVGPESAPVATASPVILSSKPKNGGGLTLAGFFMVVFGFAAVLAAAIYLVNKPDSSSLPQVADLPVEMLPREVISHSEFFYWFTAWRKVDGYLRMQEFSLVRQGDLYWSGLQAVPQEDAPVSPETSRYVWSPDGKFYVDYLDGFGSGQVKVWLGTADGKRGELFSRAAPGYFHEAFWLSDGRLVVFGTKAELKPDGDQLCVEVAGSENCFERLTVDVIDVAAGGVMTYESEKHFLGVNPYGIEARERWKSSLTDLERARRGVAPDSIYETIRGEVTAVGDDGSFTVAAGGVATTVFPVERVQVIDSSGGAFGLDLIKPGLEIEAVALRFPGNDWAAAQRITVITARDLLIFQPVDGSHVGSLQLRAAARQGIGEVAVRATNLRTGRRIVDETISLKPEESAWREFGMSLDVTAEAKPGDRISLVVLESGDEESAVSVVFTHDPEAGL